MWLCFWLIVISYCLAYQLYIGSPKSTEGDERREEKPGYIIKQLDPEKYERLMKEWDTEYPKP